MEDARHHQAPGNSGTDHDVAACSPAKQVILALWADGELESTVSPGSRPQESAGPAESALVSHGLRADGRTVSPEVLRHIESCPECLREVKELAKLSRVLTTGLERLGDEVRETMDAGIERTLQGLREEPFDARMLRSSRRALRLVLWGALLGLSLAAFCTLLIAVYQALGGGGS